MQIYIASDHAGYELKNNLSDFLRTQGYEVEDLGPHTLDPADDYPDYCTPLAKKVAQDTGSFGIVIGHSGQGEAMAVNRTPGARAAVFYGGPTQIVTLSREHNDANVLSLGAHFVSAESAQQVVVMWLNTPFSHDERHVRRIEKFG